jgi:hypothetical protein
MLEEGLPDICDAKAPRRSFDQTDTEAILQIRKTAA